jgi:hypothetical protein
LVSPSLSLSAPGPPGTMTVIKDPLSGKSSTDVIRGPRILRCHRYTRLRTAHTHTHISSHTHTHTIYRHAYTSECPCVYVCLSVYIYSHQHALV